jgi:hypothetical protein
LLSVLFSFTSVLFLLYFSCGNVASILCFDGDKTPSAKLFEERLSEEQQKEQAPKAITSSYFL